MTMINQTPPYDANDHASLAYGLTKEDLVLDAGRDADDLANLDLWKVLYDLSFTDKNIPHTEPIRYRIMDHALKLFIALVNDPKKVYSDIPMPDLLAAALDTATIWEVG